MKISILTIIILGSFIFSNAQTASGDIQTYLNNIIQNQPGNSGNDYSEPTLTELETWESIITQILEDDIPEANTLANSLNYQVTEFTDTSLNPNQLFYVLEEMNGQQNNWGTYVFNPSPLRGNLVLQAPHSNADVNTGSQAVFCFKNNLAKAVFLNGTHRCNQSTFSSCSGTTSVCGSSQAYRISDLAHNTLSAFQKATEVVFTEIPNAAFIQLHGFSKQSTDPSLIISNGSREKPFKDYAIELTNALIAEDNTLDAKIAHIDTDWSRLIGFTNTQSRYSNYSIDACTESAEGSTGRFIHVEQELVKLRINSIGWQKMSNALSNIFQVDADGDGVESAADPDDNDACNPNPNNGNCAACSQTIAFDDFENGLGIWNDGGNNAFNSTLNSLGDKSMRLRHGDENGNPVDVNSSIFTSQLDLTTFDNIKVDFSYISPINESFDANDKFFLEVSTDGGNTYSIINTWEYNVDFIEGLRYFDSLILEGPFTQNTVLRLRTFANSDLDRIWVDNISIKGCESGTLMVNDLNEDIKVSIYPNPTYGNINIETKSSILGLEIYSISGQRVYSEKYDGIKSISRINLSNRESGLYFLKILFEDNSLTKKIILK